MTEWVLDRRIRLFAPAKVNLGLEVIGRRPNGYHEVVTVMETVSLFDTIDLAPADDLTVSSSAGITPGDDLALRALHLLEHAGGVRIKASVWIEKRIPIAAGLGGGSSDAGSLIGAVGGMLGLPEPKLTEIAATLGSDVPFFVRGGTALATGTGTAIESFRTPGRRWYVIVVPAFQIEQKTAHLYSELTDEDFTDGTQTKRLANNLRCSGLVQSDQMMNVFSRPLTAFDQFRTACSAMKSAGAAHVMPSGAGPSAFTTCETFSDAKRIRSLLSSQGYETYVATSFHASWIARQGV